VTDMAIPVFQDTYATAAASQLAAVLGRPLRQSELDRLSTVASQRLADGDRPAAVVNTYNNVRAPMKLSTAASWVANREKGVPILTGYGTLFKNHTEYDSVVGAFVRYLMDGRKVAKNQMFDLIRTGRALDDPEVKAKNQVQLILKLLNNSWYGAQGERGFHFYSNEIPPSVTYAGQNIISSTLWTFEGFLANNLYLQDVDELMHHVAECVKHCADQSLSAWGLEPADDATLVETLVQASAPGWDARPAAERLVATMSDTARDALSFRGRLYEFLSCDRVMGLLDVALSGEIKEADPKHLASHHPEGKAALEELWTGLGAWVAIPWLAGDLPRRAATMRRRAVIACDTDSNFLYLGPWMEWLGQSYNLAEATPEERLTALNVMVYLLRLLNDEVMWTLTKNLQIPEDKRRLINFKSEFVISRMMLTGGKKHYAA